MMVNYHNGYKMEILIANFSRYYRFEFSASSLQWQQICKKGGKIKIFTTLYFLEELKLGIVLFFFLWMYLYMYTQNYYVILEFYIFLFLNNTFP